MAMDYYEAKARYVSWFRDTYGSSASTESIGVRWFDESTATIPKLQRVDTADQFTRKITLRLGSSEKQTGPHLQASIFYPDCKFNIIYSTANIVTKPEEAVLWINDVSHVRYQPNGDVAVLCVTEGDLRLSAYFEERDTSYVHYLIANILEENEGDTTVGRNGRLGQSQFSLAKRNGVFSCLSPSWRTDFRRKIDFDRVSSLLQNPQATVEDLMLVKRLVDVDTTPRKVVK